MSSGSGAEWWLGWWPALGTGGAETYGALGSGRIAWRMGWDSNPRGGCPPGGFQDRCLKPLGHPSPSSMSTLRGGSTSPACWKTRCPKRPSWLPLLAAIRRWPERPTVRPPLLRALSGRTSAVPRPTSSALARVAVSGRKSDTATQPSTDTVHPQQRPRLPDHKCAKPQWLHPPRAVFRRCGPPWPAPSVKAVVVGRHHPGVRALQRHGPERVSGGATPYNAQRR